MRDRLKVQRTLYFTEKMAEDVQRLADELNVAFPEIIRECVERDLPKLRDRERKRRKARKK